MGIVNLTPDSFADGDPARDSRKAIEHSSMAASRCGPARHRRRVDPAGRRAGTAEVELAGCCPSIAAALRLRIPVSVDTRTPAVMQAALELGVDIVNDVQALRAPGALMSWPGIRPAVSA